jgi:hypothetical protein
VNRLAHRQIFTTFFLPTEKGSGCLNLFETL